MITITMAMEIEDAVALAAELDVAIATANAALTMTEEIGAPSLVKLRAAIQAHLEARREKGGARS